MEELKKKILPEELHRMGDCQWYEAWLQTGQRKNNMFDPEWNQLCKNCRAQKFGQPDAKKQGYPDWKLSSDDEQKVTTKQVYKPLSSTDLENAKKLILDGQKNREKFEKDMPMLIATLAAQVGWKTGLGSYFPKGMVIVGTGENYIKPNLDIEQDEK